MDTFLCLRVASFFSPTKGMVMVFLRRTSAGKRPEFKVYRRWYKTGVQVQSKTITSYPHACRRWDEEVVKLADQGLHRANPVIGGFHEEG